MYQYHITINSISWPNQHPHPPQKKSIFLQYGRQRLQSGVQAPGIWRQRHKIGVGSPNSLRRKQRNAGAILSSYPVFTINLRALWWPNNLYTLPLWHHHNLKLNCRYGLNVTYRSYWLKRDRVGIIPSLHFLLLTVWNYNGYRQFTFSPAAPIKTWSPT